MLNKRPFSLKVFDRRVNFRRNGPELALSLSKGLSKGQSFIRVKPMPGWLYILRLRSAALYTGATTDLDQRYKDHLDGKGSRTTQLDPAMNLVYSEEFGTFTEARRREAQIKRWSKSKKEALVSGDLAKLKELAKSRK